MARTRSENYEDIALAILGHAARLFGTQGYERSSIADLAEACGLSRGALYHYFDSKEAILFAMLDTHVRGLLGKLEAAMLPGGTPVEQLTRLIEAMVICNAGSPHEQVILLNDLPSLSAHEQSEIKGLENKIVDLMASVLVQIDSGGKINKSTRKVYTMILFGIINYTYTWYKPDLGVKPKQFAKMATELFLDGILASSPAASLQLVAPHSGPKVRSTRR